MTLHDQRFFTGGCHYSEDCTQYTESCQKCPVLITEVQPKIHLNHQLSQLTYQLIPNLQIITPSRWLAKCAKESTLLGQFKITAIPNSINLDLFKPHDKTLAKIKLNLNPEKIYFILGARDLKDYRKGMDSVLESIKYLHSHKPQLPIAFITYGKGNEAFQTNDFECIHYQFINDSQQMTTLLNAADVYVTMTREDNLPNTIMEAMACGLPILATDVGGVPEMVESNFNGVLVKKEDSIAMAQRIIEITNNSSLRQ